MSRDIVANDLDQAVASFRNDASGASAADICETLQLIAKDMADDAASFDGKPFTGRTVGAQFGNHGAAIAALCAVVERLTLVVEQLVDREAAAS